MKTVIRPRETKYCRAIRETLKNMEHASNAQLLASLRLEFPELSATTVHRATSRLAERGEIGIAPKTRDGAMRYDRDTSSHDHFNCIYCDKLRDARVRDVVTPILEQSIGDCSISGNLVISGVCRECKANGVVV